jgi:putative ABC transport system permease protein
MKTLIKISWRNVWRNKTRSLVIILAIGFGLWGGIFATAIFSAMITQQFNNSIRNQVSHIQVHNPDFLKDRNASQVIDDSGEIENLLSADRRVQAFSSRVITSGMLASASMTMGVEIFGVQSEMELNTRNFQNNIIEGEYLDADFRNAIIVGQSLAEKAKLSPGNRMVLTFQDAEGDITSAAFRVAGIYRTANTSLDQRNVFVRKSDLESLLGKENMVNEMAILLHDIDDTAAIQELLQQSFPQHRIRDWAEISPELSFMTQLSGTMMLVLVMIILLALAFGLVNTMLMTIFERTRELGVLMSVGMNKMRVFSMILLETTFLTISGSALGMVLGSITVGLTSETGIDFTALGADALSDFGIDAVIFPQIDPTFYWYLVAMVMVTAIVSSIYPAYKALSLNPADAVRKE